MCYHFTSQHEQRQEKQETEQDKTRAENIIRKLEEQKLVRNVRFVWSLYVQNITETCFLFTRNNVTN